MQKRVIFLILIAILGIAGGIGIFLTKKNTPIQPIQEEIEEKTITQSDIPKVAYPEWFSNHPAGINIQNEIEERRREIQDEQQNLIEEFAPNIPATVSGYDYTVTFERIQSGPYDSIIAEEVAYTGGAHRNIRYITATAKNGVVLSLEEYLTDIGKTEQELITKLQETIESNSESYFQTNPITSLSDIQNFSTQTKQNGETGIQLIFAPYEIGSFAQGTIRFDF